MYYCVQINSELQSYILHISIYFFNEEVFKTMITSGYKLVTENIAGY